MAAPLISVITINYNNVVGLRRTIESVVAQSYNDFEYLVIDGGSNDGSVDVINAHSNKITYSVSERDSGIYNAMNKGIKQAKGKYLLFLNSGDCFYKADSLSLAAPALQVEDIVYGDLYLHVSNSEQRVKQYPDAVSFSYFMYESLPHPSSFIKRDLFERAGLYNESFKIVSDWGFFLKTICGMSATYKHIQQVVSTFYLDGISSTPENARRVEDEKQSIINNEFPMFADTYRLMHHSRGLEAEVNRVNQSLAMRILRRLKLIR